MMKSTRAFSSLKLDSTPLQFSTPKLRSKTPLHRIHSASILGTDHSFMAFGEDVLGSLMLSLEVLDIFAAKLFLKNLSSPHTTEWSFPSSHLSPLTMTVVKTLQMAVIPFIDRNYIILIIEIVTLQWYIELHPRESKSMSFPPGNSYIRSIVTLPG